MQDLEKYKLQGPFCQSGDSPVNPCFAILHFFVQDMKKDISFCRPGRRERCVSDMGCVDFLIDSVYDGAAGRQRMSKGWIL